MERYDYFSHVCEDVRNYIEENGIEVNQENREEIEQQLNDDLFVDDSVTGNGSGSYFCNAWKAEEAISHNWDLLAEAIDEFGTSTKRPCGIWSTTTNCLTGRSASRCGPAW